MNLTNEVIIFFAFIISGMIGGCFFDLFRAIRRNFETNNIMVYIEDFLFWIILGGVSLFTSYLVSDGQIRVYMLVSTSTGNSLMAIIFLRR